MTLRSSTAVLSVALLASLSACTAAAPKASPAPSTPPPTASPSPSPTPPPSFPQTYARVSGGVVRIDVQDCRKGGSGTGFLVEPGLVATVAHVVEGASTIRVTQAQHSVAAVVLGADEERDLALLRTSTPLDGHVFTLDPDGPVVGERVGVIGFPSGDSGLLRGAGSKSFKEGSVNGLDRKVAFQDGLRTGLVELDALARAGNSGSPVMRVDGTVVGLLDAGPADDDAARARFAVSARTAVPLLRGWQDNREALQAADCSVDPDGSPVALEVQPGGDVQEVVATLNLYYRSIDQGDYETAYAQFHPQSQVPGGAASFAKGVGESEDSQIDYRSVRRSGRDLVAWVAFRSRQPAAKGPDGLDCTDWSLDYVMRESDGLWLIVKSQQHDDEPRYRPCEPGD